MKAILLLTFLQSCIFLQTLAFQPQVPSLSTSSALFGYVPDGFTKESYEKFKKAEAAKKQKKNLGRMGPKGFQSRSFQSFQEALERGEATHLMPVMNAKERYVVDAMSIQFSHYD